MSFVTQLIDGLSLGSVYAVIALGYTMVYGIAKMLNFAHGDVIMVGGYVCYEMMVSAGMSPAIGILAAILACTVLGVTIERFAYKPLRRAGSLAVLITAIGVSYFLQNAAMLIFGSEIKTFTSVVPSFFLEIGKLSISGLTLVTIVVSVIIMIALTVFIKKSKIGKAMRAVSEDKDAAELMGINVNSTISATFAIGSALAAIAGVLLCSTSKGIMPTTGSMPGIKAFTAAVFGGVGSIPGAMVGGLLLGVIETFSKAYISYELTDAIVFAILIIVLLVKPTGLFGKKINEKV